MRADWFPERGALPSLLGRYIYADIYEVFGGELPTVQLFAGGSSGDSGLGVFATNLVFLRRRRPRSHLRWRRSGAPSAGSSRQAAWRRRAAPRVKGLAARASRPRLSARRATTFARAPRAEMSSSVLAGNDTLSGRTSNDLICGGTGNDTLGAIPATTPPPPAQVGQGAVPGEAANRERVDCSSGFDQVRSDKLDRRIDCEKRIGVRG